MKNESADLSLFFNRKKVLIVPLSLKPLVGASYVSFAAIFQITAHSLRCASTRVRGRLLSHVTTCGSRARVSSVQTAFTAVCVTSSQIGTLGSAVRLQTRFWRLAVAITDLRLRTIHVGCPPLDPFSLFAVTPRESGAMLYTDAPQSLTPCILKGAICVCVAVPDFPSAE